MIEETKAMCPLDEIIGVREAAAQLGISRAAVVHAVQYGRIEGKKVGRSWVLLRRSVDAYHVTACRVVAGRISGMARCE